jgi:peptidoglycan-N-acetylglucosamine deacetylase
MDAETSPVSTVSAAGRTGLAAIGLSACLFPFMTAWAALPLVLFLIRCAAASFSPRSSFFLPVICRGHTGQKAVALTFDDGPDPLTTPQLLEMLAQHGMKAAFFVAGQAAQRHPDLIHAILSQGHLIGNHSYSHSPFLMLHPYRKLFQEVADAQKIIMRYGISPLAFRPPVGLTNPKLGPVLSQLGMVCITFSCRAYDRGNRQIRGLAGKILKKVRPDDIILLHDVRPSTIGDVPDLLKEMQSILSGLKKQGFSIFPLDKLIGRPVMTFKKTF